VRVTVTFERVVKRFGPVVAVRGIDLTVADGECLVLLGPSGCGKTTLLRLLAGLDQVDEGRMLIGDRVVNDLPPAERNVAMVFQNYALYPHLTVFENIAFPLRARRTPSVEIDRRVRDTLGRLELAPLLDRRPAQLSGGQQQRVALARAIVRQPSVYLMDEPLSNLDAQLRAQTRAELKRLQQDLRTTTLYVTHDQAEAMTLGDRIALFRAGAIEQIGAPLDLYRQPANTFVASFVGHPPMNLWPATGGVSGGLRAAGLDIPRSAATSPGIDLLAGVRAEDVRLFTTPQPGAAQARVLVVEPMGNETLVTMESAGARIVARGTADLAVSAEGTLWFAVAPEKVVLFAASTGEKLQV
jgi:ABC-type sugar transport system ATPase subunit